MATKIHPLAEVNKDAQLDNDVEVGAYAIIGKNVKIGKGTRIEQFSQIFGYTEIGKNCHIFSYAVIGSPPQDLKYKGDKSSIVIGDNNTIREFVTVNPGTSKGSKTIIGNGNLIMAYSHIAHNCIVGNNNVFANCATLAGHVVIEDKVHIGGLSAIHQFCRIGRLSIIGGCSKVVQDIPPYSLCDGHPAKVYGINTIGLKRAKFSQEKINILKKAFKIIFFSNHPLSTAIKMIKKDLPQIEELDYLIKFISSSQRGISK
ncbi:MAG: acyl-ACP--UDP-N-acetylglucosamine O-acyltransferase [Candidatus Omnitrophica bacterium]|nr:acyl-ACP--UDP-N-acetylglucosamine O-acyltransferase [Candidatus Omnitrophota bacterium]